MNIDLEVSIGVSLEHVWDQLGDLETHPQWMKDAESLEFTSERTSGVGTAMRVVTKVGPFRTIDILEVAEWEELSRISIRHVGVVKGTGTFRIEPQGEGTNLTWSESLEFPWWLGGELTALAAKPVLTRIWRDNLRRLAERISNP